jgi:transcription-repair coupling factor (superfamily II helicase)
LNRGRLELQDFLAKQTEYNYVTQQVATHPWNMVYGVSGSQRGAIAALLAESQQKDLLYIAENTQKIKEIIDDLQFWLPGYRVYYFPALDILPFEVLAQSRETRWQRLETIEGLLFAGGPVAVVTTVEALRKNMQPPNYIRQAFRTLEVGQRLDIQELLKWLVDRGYQRMERVEEKGQIALRGGILDIYCPTAENPSRIEFFDDEVDSIRSFSPETQRSTEKLNKLWLAPASECIFNEEHRQQILKGLASEAHKEKHKKQAKNKDCADEQNLDAAKVKGRAGQLMELVAEGCFFPGYEQLLPYTNDEPALLADYFPRKPLTVLVEPSRQREASQFWEKEYQQTCSDLLEKGRICPGQIANYVSLDELIQTIGHQGMLFLSLLPKRPSWFDKTKLLGISAKTVSLFLKKAQLLADELREWRRLQYSVMIVVSTDERARRLQESLRDLGIEAGYEKDEYKAVAHKISIVSGKVSAGFDFAGFKLAVVTEHELYFQPKQKTGTKAFKDGKRQVLLEDLKPGDYVVHVNYGIGRYEGIENIAVADAQRDYLMISYNGADRLYVPTDQASLLQKYNGQEGARPKLSKLGGSEWAKVKAKAKKAIEDMADELLSLYAAREALSGFAFVEDTPWQKEFEEAFAYEETADQLRSIAEVKADMELPRPMDRLLCGDVGYGKTEVAMRAAFKAATAGKQVAILVPTTVLSQQHFRTFSQRFEGFALEVGVLNRFRSAKEQKETLQRLAEGRIDIIIGTHRLLSKDVVFKDLGLLVVDEEQRFGVTHKERIKQLKQTVDVLTLTATPIPRTLHMAMTGIRDLSVIETPPEERYPVQTYVVEHSLPLIREAIRRELGRGGQVYYLHNRIEDIDRVSEMIRQLVPEARVAVAHGRMTELALERVMYDFMEGNFDVLVCTTIIESGLDIANANTVIIDQADRLGLAQLYQIRGRVGRSNRVAYAYLTYSKEKTLTEIAEKRLSAIREFTELGAGYKIAMRDLEIRGAGNLLGAQQHGQIAAVGFDLYCKMLEEEVRLKRQQNALEKGLPVPPFEQEPEAVTIDLQIKAFIPASYVEDEGTKIGFYQRINNAGNKEDIEDLRDELVDRFGDIPEPLENLLHIGAIKTMAKGARIESVTQQGRQIKIKMVENHGLTGPELMDFVRRYRRQVSFNAAQGLEIVVQLAQLDQHNIIQFLEKITEELFNLVSKG